MGLAELGKTPIFFSGTHTQSDHHKTAPIVKTVDNDAKPSILSLLHNVGDDKLYRQKEDGDAPPNSDVKDRPQEPVENPSVPTECCTLSGKQISSPH